jgi:hypothetical protein
MIFLLFGRLRSRASDVPSLAKLLKRLEAFLLVLLLMGVSYGVSEHASAFDSLWLVWQTVTTVGYGDMPPKTVLGMSGVMVTGMVSILLLPYLLTAFLEYREDRILRKKTGMEMNPHTSSTLLVCCRNAEDLLVLIRELRWADPDAPVCIVDDRLEELPPKVARLPGVHFVKGSILSDETYTQAGIETCGQVMIFPHEPDHAASDATTESVARIVQRLAPDAVRIVFLLVDPNNAKLFAGVTSAAIYQDFAIYAALQELRSRGASQIFTHLMSSTSGANPTTFPAGRVVGWTWGRFQRAALTVSTDRNVPINPLALIHDGKPDPCPAPDALIQAGDLLSLIVHPSFDYTDFEAAMAQHDQGQSA